MMEISRFSVDGHSLLAPAMTNQSYPTASKNEVIMNALFGDSMSPLAFYRVAGKCSRSYHTSNDAKAERLRKCECQ